MLKFGLIVFVLALGFAILTSDSDPTPTSLSSSGMSYGQCLHDPNTQFQVGVYKQAYPNLSNSSIAHIICK